MVDEELEEEERLFKGVLRLNTKFLGLALGLIMCLAIFVATNWLVVKGGHITPN